MTSVVPARVTEYLHSTMAAAASVHPTKRKRQLVANGNDRQPEEPYLPSFVCIAAASCDELPQVQAAALRLALGAMVQPRLGAASPGAALTLDLVGSVAERVQSRSVVVRSMKQLRAAIADQQVATVELDPDLRGEFSPQAERIKVLKTYEPDMWTSLHLSLVITRPLRLVSGTGGVATIPVPVKVHTENASAIETEDESLLAMWRGGESVSIHHRCSVGEVVLANIHANVSRGTSELRAVKVHDQDGSVVPFKIRSHKSLKKLMDVFAQSRGGTPSAYRFFFDGRRIPSHWDEYIPTPDELQMENSDVIEAMLEQVGCVAAPLPATFGETDLSLPGCKFLGSVAVQAASAEDVAALVFELGGCLDEVPKSFPDRELLDQAGRANLMRLVDEHNTNDNSKTVDLRVPITEDQLIEAVGVDACSRIFTIFGGHPNAIRLRRVEASKGESVAFHTDYSLKTMQIPLNSDTEYDGGRLVWVQDGRFEVPPRHAGSATIHTCGVVHAVTPMTSGVRYGLFLCKLPEDALDVDLTYLVAPTLVR